MLSRLCGACAGVTPFGGEETDREGVSGTAGDWGVVVGGRDLNPGGSVFRSLTRFFSKPCMRNGGRETTQPAEDWRPPALEL